MKCNLLQSPNQTYKSNDKKTFLLCHFGLIDWYGKLLGQLNDYLMWKYSSLDRHLYFDGFADMSLSLVEEQKFGWIKDSRGVADDWPSLPGAESFMGLLCEHPDLSPFFPLAALIISVACTGQFYAGGCQNTPLHQPAGKSIVLKSQPAYLSWWTWRAWGEQAGWGGGWGPPSLGQHPSRALRSALGRLGWAASVFGTFQKWPARLCRSAWCEEAGGLRATEETDSDSRRRREDGTSVSPQTPLLLNRFLLILDSKEFNCLLVCL